MKNNKFKLVFLFFLSLVAVFFLPTPKTNAQTPCPGQNANALLSAPVPIVGFGTTAGVCNQDPSAAFTPQKIPTYAELKSLYYTQSKVPDSEKYPVPAPDPSAALENMDNTGLSTHLSTKKVVYITGNLTINSNMAGTNTAVVFVDGTLTFGNIPGHQFTYGDAKSGLVFIVKGKVYIDQSITNIDGIIISSDNIYTAASAAPGCSHTVPILTQQLVINGSLISLDENIPPTKQIEFCRTLAVNNVPAEVINHQVKYLVILRDILSNTENKWAEIQ